MKTLPVLLIGLLAAFAPAASREAEVTLPASAPSTVRFLKRGDEPYPIGVRMLHADAVHDKFTGEGVLIAVVDTGIDAGHFEFQGPKVKDVKNWTGDNLTAGIDPYGHGSHVASIAAAPRNRAGTIGVAPNARLLDARVLGADGYGYAQRITDGVDWAVANGADVINLSLTAHQDFAPLKRAIERADRAGVIVIAAAGNSGPSENTTSYPAGYATVIAVAAVDGNGVVTDFSSRGTAVFCAAMGGKVPGAYPGPRGGLLADFDGTSMAAPHVAGLAALWIEANGDTKKVDRPAKFRHVLMTSCENRSACGRDTTYGYGIPDARKVVGLVD